MKKYLWKLTVALQSWICRFISETLASISKISTFVIGFVLALATLKQDTVIPRMKESKIVVNRPGINRSFFLKNNTKNVSIIDIAVKNNSELLNDFV